MLSPFYIITSALFIILMGYFAWKRLSIKDNFVRTYFQNSISTILGQFFFGLALIFVLLAHLDIITFETTSSNIVHGGDIIFTIDVSKSMDAQDVKNGNLSLSRLETAKKAILDYINMHAENRYGIILFAGKSLISSPLTTDTQVLSDIIGSLDTKSIREGGTNLEDALNLSIKRFSSATGALDNKNNKTLVLLTDGGETDDIPSWEKIGDIVKQANNINFIIAGIGSDDGGKIPQGTDFFGNVIYKTQDGREVITKIGSENLARLGNVLNAKTLIINNTNNLPSFGKIIDDSVQKNFSRMQNTRSDDSMRIFLFLSGVCLVISMLVIRIKK